MCPPQGPPQGLRLNTREAEKRSEELVIVRSLDEVTAKVGRMSLATIYPLPMTGKIQLFVWS